MNRCALLAVSAGWLLAFGVPGSAHAQSVRRLPPNEQGAPLFAQASVADMQPAWQYFAFGSDLGASRIVVSAVDGVAEIIVSGGGSFGVSDIYWFILRFNPGTQGYDQVFVSPVVPPGDSIQRLALVTTDSGPKLVVGTAKGIVQVWDQGKRTIDVEFQAPGDSLEALCVADVEPGGRPEIVITSGSHLYVCEIDGDVLWDLAGPGGIDVVAAQMDEDPSLEIATTNGRVVDVDSRTVQWTWPAGFGLALRAGDTDGDGMAELISAVEWSLIWAYDVDTQLPKWSITVNNPSCITLTDMDDDGTLELLVGEAQSSWQKAYNTTTQLLEWSVFNPGGGTFDIAYGDVDDDGTVEIIWASGYTIGSGVLYVADWTVLPDEQIEWQSITIVGPFHGPELGDIDNDGVPEIVTVTKDSDGGFKAGTILVFDSEDLHLKDLSDELPFNWTATWDIKLRNVNIDPSMEIILGTSDGSIAIIDYKFGVFTKVWEGPVLTASGSFRCVDVADVDGDGELEAVGGANNSLHVYKLVPAEEEWESPHVGEYVRDMALGQTDGDAATEIIAVSSDFGAHVFDGTTKVLEAVLPGAWTCVRAMPRGLGQPDLIVLGDELGGVTIFRHDGTGYTAAQSGSFGTHPIDGITLDPSNFLWVGANSTLSLYGSGTLLWTSGQFGTPFGANTIIVDPGARMVVTAGPYGLTGFSLR